MEGEDVNRLKDLELMHDAKQVTVREGFNLLHHRSVHPTGSMRTGTPFQNPRRSVLGNHHPPSAPSP